jgi:predicted nucleic acid-binding protein
MIALDTDVLIEVLRERQPALEWLNQLGDTHLYVPGFVAMELYQGCRDKRELQRTQRAMSEFAIIWPTARDCDRAMSAFAKLRLSHSIGIIDCLIAQTAIGYGLELATFNLKHYVTISDLAVLEPYSR